jgi:hypothetical protein
MRIAAVVFAAAAIASSLAACTSSESKSESKPESKSENMSASAEPKAEMKTEPVSGTLASAVVTSSATVESIDQATRRVTLRNMDGKSMAMIVPPEVRNLSQVNVGDQVVVTYHESLAYEVKKPGEATPGVSMVAAAGRAKEGDKPGAGAGAATTVTVTIEAIDKTVPSVTLRRPDGTLFTTKVRDRAKLDRVAVGDLVEITYTEALAVSVQKK